MIGTVQVPGSVSAMMQLRLGQAGREAVGFAANIPHYLAQSEFPQGAAELVRQISRNASIALPVGDLEAAAAEATREIDKQVAQSGEVQAIVQALEKQFDAFISGTGRESRATLMSQPDDIPTADEIGAELEAFLADQFVQGGDVGPDGDSQPQAPAGDDSATTAPPTQWQAHDATEPRDES